MAAHQRFLKFAIGEVAAVADAASGQDGAGVAAAQQLPDHVIVRRFAGAGGKKHDCVVGLDGIEGVMAR